MMMNLYRRNDRRSFFAPLVIAALIIVSFVFGIDYASGGFVRSVVRSAVFSVVGNIPGSDTLIGYLASRGALQRENQELKDALARLAEQSAYIDSVVAENETLRALTILEEGPGIGARVLSSFDVSPYGTFVIKGGADVGIAQGSIVVTPGGFVLGRVSDVGSDTSVVESLFAPRATHSLVIGSVVFSAEGRGGGYARGRVPRESPVTFGDTAIAPEFGGKPAAIVLRVDSASTSAESVIHLRHPVNTDALTYVYVIPLP